MAKYITNYDQIVKELQCKTGFTHLILYSPIYGTVLLMDTNDDSYFIPRAINPTSIETILDEYVNTTIIRPCGTSLMPGTDIIAKVLIQYNGDNYIVLSAESFNLKRQYHPYNIFARKIQTGVPRGKVLQDTAYIFDLLFSTDEHQIAFDALNNKFDTLSNHFDITIKKHEKQLREYKYIFIKTRIENIIKDRKSIDKLYEKNPSLPIDDGALFTEMISLDVRIGLFEQNYKALINTALSNVEDDNLKTKLQNIYNLIINKKINRFTEFLSKFNEILSNPVPISYDDIDPYNANGLYYDAIIKFMDTITTDPVV
jgi:hypothetical protein